MAADLKQEFTDASFGDVKPSGKNEPKVPTSLQKLSNDVNAEMLPKVTSVYNIGKARDFSAKKANLAKYTTYGTETFGKLGFDPFVGGGTSSKSGMDALYDNNTHWSSDIGRAYDGMFKLAGIGIQDTFGLGAFADQGNYLSFEENMNKYSSSRGGNAGFWSNTMLSSGYTMGIIGGIVAEEAALAGITALSGLTAAPGTVAVGATLFARGMERIKTVGNLLKTVNKLQDVGTATSWLGRNTKSFMKALNPLENTIDFVKDVEHLKTLNGWQQAAAGVGAVVRDARKITMSHGESKLEADMAAKEFKQKMYDDYYADIENVGKDMPETKAKQIEDEANKMHSRIYASNFGLIYATNAITFDNMFKNMKSSRKAFNLLNDAYKVSRTQGGRVAVDVVAKTFGNTVRKKLGQITYKSATNYALSSSMEGVQEVGQDIISETFKSYHARNVKGTQVRGGMYDLLHTDIKGAVKGIANEQGFSTFLSGALMGVFASPMGVVSGQANQFLMGGGAQNAYQRTFNNKAFKAEKISIEAKRKEKAKELTEWFNNEKNFVDGFSNPIYSQNELQEDILNAAENNDQKTLKDKQHESFSIGVHKLLESGLENEFAEHLNQMAEQFGPAELNEVFARTDITEENQNKWKDKLKTQASEVKKLRGVYDEIKQNVTNPNSMQGLKVSDPDYLQKFIKYRAFENFKKELLFSHAKISDRATRLSSLKKELDTQTSLSSFEVNSMVDTKALGQQIELLKLEVDANDKMNLTGEGLTKSKVAKEKLKAYEAYNEKLTAYKALQNNSDGTVYESEAFDDLFEAYNNLIIAGNKDNADSKLVIQSETERENNKKVFEKIFDYINLGQENEYYQEYVDTLMNPTGSSNFIKGQEAMLQRLEDNKEEHISNALKAFEEKTVSSDMLNALYDAGLFFDLNDLDELIKNRIMPSEIFDVENNKEATPEQITEAQKIIGAYIKKLTGKSIVSAKTSLNKQGRKLKSDKRTVSTIIRQYNLKLNKEVKLSSKEGKRLLEKLMAADNKFLTKMDREILDKLGEQDVSIKFVTNGSLPVTITADGVIELDLRFTGRDFKNSVMSFENLMVTGLTQNKIAQQLKEDDDLWLATRHAMEQAKEAYIAKYSDARVEELDVFDYPDLFLTEAMNDLAFQDFLADIDDNIQPASKSLWGTLTDSIKEIVEKDFDKKLVGRVVNIAAKALDSSIVEEIGEKVSETEVVDNEAKEAKLKELETLAKELGLRWNVNVEVLSSQEEAQKILNNIQDPFFQKFSDILQDALYGAETMGFRLQKGINDVSLKELIADVYNKSESLSELITNLKELSVYQTNGKVAGMVDWLVNNVDSISDGFEVIKNIFFQAEGETTAGFYDEKTNTAYIVADAVKPNTAYHEIFLHPFLINLEKSNPEFFKQLVAEAKQNAEAVAYVEKNYGTEAVIGARQFEHELVGRVYDLNVNNQLDKTKNAGLIKRLAEFIKKMMVKVAEFFGISKTDIKRINEKKATISDLAKYSVAGTAKMDLGKVIEADIPIVTPTAQKTKKVTRERVITTQKDVNKGGNVVSLINASDRPDIFGEYLHPEIIFNTPIVDEWTKKIQELGQELDAAGITNWKYGQIRADVGGRLIIDVSAEVPVMGATSTTTNTPNAKVIKLKAELDAIEERIANLSKAGDTASNAPIFAANAEYQAAQGIINFSKNKFPELYMPLYQYLRMLNNRMPVVGQYTYYINRDNTTNPSVEKRGVVTSVNGNSFTYVDDRGITITSSVEGAETIEYNNPYFLFTDSEVKDNISYSETETFIKNRREQKLKEARDKTATNQSFRTDTKALEEHWDKANNGQIGVSPIGVDFIDKLKDLAKKQLIAEAEANKKLFKKVVEPTRQEILSRAKQLFIDKVQSTKQDDSEFEWSVMDGLNGFDTKFKSSTNTKSIGVRDVRGQSNVFNYTFHENYDAEGRRFVSILIPVSDPTNPSRPSYYAGISILIPDSMSASDVANPILEEAKKLSAGNAVTTTLQMKDMAIPMAKQIIEEKLKNKSSESNLNAQKIADLENQKKDLEAQLENEPESIPFTDTKNVQTGTKTVKFLMYKSTGTGSTAESKGEWVPLIAIGKHSNGSEWFVKALHEGQDPKFNKYGSSVFADIDKELKVMEPNLFDDYENWVTENVNETIQEEIEVPVEDESEETPFDNEDNRTTDSYVNEAEKIQASINNLEKQIDKLNVDLQSDDINFVQRRAIRSKITNLSIELNDLYLQLNDIQPALQNITPAQQVVETELEYVPRYDYNNNEIISPETPWITIPEVLRKDIALIYGKSLTKLDAQDILKIKEEMKTNPLYIKAISDFSNKRLDQQNAELGQNELIENKKKVAAAKASRQAQIQNETDANRIAKRNARQNKVPASDEEFLSAMLKDFDISVLSPKEIKMLVKKYKESSALIPFTAEDIIAYVSHKKLENDVKIKRDQDYTEQLETNKKNKQIKENYDLLSKRKLRFVNDLNKLEILTVPANGMVKFISTYYPEIFALDKKAFLTELKFILDTRLKDIKSQDSSPFTFKPKAIHLQLHTLVKKLEKAKQLYPDTAKKINLALYNAGSDLRIKAVKTTKASVVSTMYSIGKKPANESRMPVKKGKYGSYRDIVKNADFVYSPEVNAELAIVKYLMDEGKVKPSALKQITKSDSSEFTAWENITDENAPEKTKSFDGVGDYVLDLNALSLDESVNAFESVITNNENLKDAIEKYAKIIIESLTAETEEESTDLSDNELDERNYIEQLISLGLTKEEAAAELIILQFLNTPEGIAIKNDEAAEIEKYRASMEAEIANGEFDGDSDELTDPQQDLLNDAEKKGLFGPKEKEQEEEPEEELDPETLVPKTKEKPEKNELQSDIEKQVTKFFEDINELEPLGVKVNNIIDVFNKQKTTDLVYAAAAYRYITNSALPAEQKLKNNALFILERKFSAGHYNDQIVIINNKIYRIAGFQSNKIVVQDLVNPNLYPEFSTDEFLNSIDKVVKPGEEFNNLNIDSLVKVTEFDYIKGAYNEILDNFTNYMSEAMALPEEELMSKLKNEITKCK